jgi:hypothetical protein
MRVVVTMLVAVALALAAAYVFGTALVMSTRSPPVQYRIVVISKQPTNCTIRVTWPHTNEFHVSSSGEALVDVPALPGGCSQVCLGIKLSDGSQYGRKVIELVRDDRVVRRLSLRQMERLPEDASGRRKISL